MNILYLSDIHFGREHVVSGSFLNRRHIQEQLIQTVANLPVNIRPHYVVVTGDIAWTGSDEEYEMAHAWFSQLLAVLGLDGEGITFCAGNHDINRKIAVQTSLSELKNDNGIILNKVDEKYKYENISSFDVQLRAYNDFCCKLGVVPYQYQCEIQGLAPDQLGLSNHWYSYTVGSKDVSFGNEKYRFVAFNTAMLSGYEGFPDDENFIGLPQVEQLIVDKRIGKDVDRYKIALFHHAERFLNTNEMNSYGKRAATLHKLLENVDLALCGHTETGAVPVPRKQGEDGILLNGGAAYYSDDHPNSFSILHLDSTKGTMENCAFLYTKGKWEPQFDLSQNTWQIQNETIKSSDSHLSDTVWTFRLVAKDAQMEVFLKYVDIGLYMNGSEKNVYFSNHKDINRLLDLSGSPDDLRIAVAPGRERCVDALLEHMGIPFFVNQQLNRGSKQVEYHLIDPEGNPIIKGIMDFNPFSDTEYGIYELLQRLQKLERVFHVRFSPTEAISVREQCAVTMLEALLASGEGLFIDDTETFIVYFSEQQMVFQFIQESLATNPEKTICISYNIPLICNLFGAKINLGNCRVYFTNLIPCDLEEVKKQADTFIDGDSRRLRLKFVNDKQQIAITLDGHENDSQDVKEMFQKIKKHAFHLKIEPQEMTFGIDIFSPDQREIEKQKIKIENKLHVMIEE